jgi:Sigma-70, region 4
VAALDDLSPDRRAVLQLLVARGRGYDQIADLLHLPEIVVRRRSHDALTELAGGPGAIDDQRRALLCDYLVGELPASRRADARQVLADDAAARRFARAAASRLSGIPGAQLPELPTEDEEVAEALDALDARRERKQELERSSRTGAWLIVGGVAAVVIAAVIGLSFLSGDGEQSSGIANTPNETTPAATSDAATLVVELKSPTGGKATGQAALRPRGSGPTDFAAQIKGVSTTENDAYVFWLDGPSVEPQRLGYYDRDGDPSPEGQMRVGMRLNGQGVPAITSKDLDQYTELLMTRENPNVTTPPKTPIDIVLSGELQVVTS